MMLKFWLVLLALAPVQSDDPLAAYREAAVKSWESAISELEQLDQQQEDPPHAILFLGSSSVKLWEEIASDMAPWPTIRRGYGGARFSDLAVFVDRLVKPHRPDAVVIFVANDITGGDQDKTPEEVLRLVKIIVAKIRMQLPQTPVFLIGVTPTSSRFAVWDQIQQVNGRMADYCAQSPHLHYIATAEHYLGADGRPRDELFRADRLHLNRDGYQLWARLIKEQLTQVLGPPKT